VVAMMAQKDAEVPECCQKTVSAVIDEGMDTDDSGKQEVSLAVIDLPSLPEPGEMENNAITTNSPRSMSLFFGCAFGFLAFVVHRRKV